MHIVLQFTSSLPPAKTLDIFAVGVHSSGTPPLRALPDAQLL
jgi:hypothetical protein